MLCAVCPREFMQHNSMIRHCSPRCGIKLLALKAKAERADLKKRKEAAKRPKDLKQEAQSAFNKYIRLRDRGQTCIDCGSPFEPQRIGGSVDAGHYRSVGSAAHLRFDERNCHAQRKNCNRPGGATPASYRLGLIARIGLAAVEALEADQTERHYKADDYRAIRDLYRQKAKELEQ